MAIIKGNDILILCNGTAIACAKSCEINVECELQPVSSATSGGWNAYVKKRKGWSITISQLVSAVKNSINMVGTTVTIKIGKATQGTRTLSADKLEGQAIVTTWNCTGTRGNLAAGSFVFQGTGALE